MSLINTTNVIPMPRFGDEHLAQVFSMFPIEVVDGEGVFLHTNDGRRILDLYGGHAVAAGKRRIVRRLDDSRLTIESVACRVD